MAIQLNFSPWVGAIAAVASLSFVSSSLATPPPDIPDGPNGGSVHESVTVLPSVTVVGQSPTPGLPALVSPGLTGFATPLAQTPLSVSVVTDDMMQTGAVQSLSDTLRLDASLSDSYNTTGYTESLSVRGFLLDQNSNFRRNGLASSNLAPLAPETLERIEVLKGVAGLQSGVASSGGLVNHVTKRPLADPATSVAWTQDDRGGSKLHLDTSTMLGTVGLRVNLVDEQLRPAFDHADGTRQLASLALLAPVTSATSVSLDLQYQRKSQPSVPGLGLLDTNGDGIGDTLPAAEVSRLNLNHQSWSQPFEVNDTSVQLALVHRIHADWTAHLAASVQTTRLNDRIAFADGCSSATVYVYPGLCANGDVDVYDYRSDGELHGVSGLDAHVDGTFVGLGARQSLRLGMEIRHVYADLPAFQAYNLAGTTNIFAPVALPANPALTVRNFNTDERSTAAYVTLASAVSARLQSFAGLRITSHNRSSVRSDGEQSVALDQTVSTPWVGASWSLDAGTTVYASWGQGVLLEQVPNRPGDFANYGQVLPALKSRQTEVGLKWQPNARWQMTAAAFTIDQPYADNLRTGAVLERIAGARAARHNGLELSASGRPWAAWTLQGSLMLLDATYTRALDPTLVGQRVTNVPRTKGTVLADYRVAWLPGLSVHAQASLESAKTVTVDGNVILPAVWQIDAGLGYRNRLWGQAAHWQLNVKNLSDRTAWREAPTAAWSGVYLFGTAPRSLQARVTVDW